MEFNDSLLRRAFLVSAMKKAKKYDHHIAYEMKNIQSIIDIIEKDADNSFVTLSKDDSEKVSYASKPEHKFNDDKRTKCSFDVYIRRRMGVKNSDLSDYSLEKFANAVIDLANDKLKHPETNIIEYSGSELKLYFRTFPKGVKNITDREVLLYTENKKKVSWVASTNFVRAFVWKCDDGTRVMDTIYPTNKTYQGILRNWALENDIRIIEDMTISTRYKLRVTLKCKYIEDMPYQDTFKYGEISKKNGDTITLSPDPSFGNVIVGTTYQPYLREFSCAGCNVSSTTTDLATVNGHKYCPKCLSKTFKHCKICEEYRPITENGFFESGYKKAPNEISVLDIDQGWVCELCSGNCINFEQCSLCKVFCHKISMKKVFTAYQNKLYCKDCVRVYLDKCDRCDKPSVVSLKYGKVICADCEKLYKKCKVCGKYDVKYGMQDVIFKEEREKDGVCAECFSKEDENGEKPMRCQKCWHYIIESQKFDVDISEHIINSSYQLKKVMCAKCKEEKDKPKIIKQGSTPHYYDGPYGNYNGNSGVIGGSSGNSRYHQNTHSSPNKVTNPGKHGDYYSMN